MNRVTLFLVDRSASAVEFAEVARGLRDWRLVEMHDRYREFPKGLLTSEHRAVLIPVELVLEDVAAIPDGLPWIGYGASTDILRAFFLGGRDYFADPWGAAEALARHRRIVTGSGWGPGDGTQALGSVFVQNEQTVVLSDMEARLWALLNRHAGRVLDRGVIADAIGRRKGKSTHSRGVDMLISRLRYNLGHDGDRIETVRGRGYRLRRG